MSVNSAYLLQSTQEKRQNLNFQFMYQKAAEAQQYSRFLGNDIYNTAVSYQFSVLPIQFNASASIGHNYNRMPEGMYTQAMTCNVSLQKTFFKNLRSALTATYSHLSNPSGTLSDVVNIRISESYVLAKKHNFNLSLTMLSSESVSKKRQQYAANLAYAYNFSVTVNRKDKKLKIDYDF